MPERTEAELAVIGQRLIDYLAFERRHAPDGGEPDAQGYISGQEEMLQTVEFFTVEGNPLPTDEELDAPLNDQQLDRLTDLLAKGIEDGVIPNPFAERANG
jgi:hypothetical protein